MDSVGKYQIVHPDGTKLSPVDMATLAEMVYAGIVQSETPLFAVATGRTVKAGEIPYLAFLIGRLKESPSAPPPRLPVAEPTRPAPRPAPTRPAPPVIRLPEPEPEPVAPPEPITIPIAEPVTAQPPAPVSSVWDLPPARPEPEPEPEPFLEVEAPITSPDVLDEVQEVPEPEPVIEAEVPTISLEALEAPEPVIVVPDPEPEPEPVPDLAPLAEAEPEAPVLTEAAPVALPEPEIEWEFAASAVAPPPLPETEPAHEEPEPVEPAPAEVVPEAATEAPPAPAPEPEKKPKQETPPAEPARKKEKAPVENMPEVPRRSLPALPRFQSPKQARYYITFGLVGLVIIGGMAAWQRMNGVTLRRDQQALLGAWENPDGSSVVFKEDGTGAMTRPDPIYGNRTHLFRWERRGSQVLLTEKRILMPGGTRQTAPDSQEPISLSSDGLLIHFDNKDLAKVPEE